ncbi:MAG: hypothetical protein HY704_14535 [Gemmatimonadetes bacterium]|nr:hypothetical protein [Gemmatimonadota bacterium]
MRSFSRSRRTLLAAALCLPLTAAPASGQDYGILSSQIAVSGREAALQLELRGGRSLEIAFRDGEVRIDGASVGRYGVGDKLERSWRELLGRAVSLDDGPLGRALVSWSPPAELPGELATLAGRIDATLESALAARTLEAPATPAAPQEGVVVEGGDALRRLLRDAARLPGMASALEDLDLNRVRLYSDQDVVIDRDEAVDAAVVMVDGDLDVHGTIRGDVLIVDGELRLHDGGRIEGDVRLVDGTLERLGGELLGSVRDIEQEVEQAVRDADVERIVERAVKRSTDRFDAFRPFRYIGRGLAGILQTLAVFAVLAVIGGAVVFFARDKLETVADTARRATGRAAGVGLAGAFLLIPACVLGVIVLAVSIIGIPLLLVWIPLFPLAAVAAAALGYLGVAHAIGEFVASHRFEGWEWMRRSNSHYYMLSGLAVLIAPFLAAYAVGMGGPWFGFLRGLLLFLGILATFAAVVVGLGAVLLSRAGTTRAFAPGRPAELADTEPDLADVEGTDA